MDPREQLNKTMAIVADEQSFLKFVEALISDRVRAVEAEKKNPRSPFGPNAGEDWENTSVTYSPRLKAGGFSHNACPYLGLR